MSRLIFVVVAAMLVAVTPALADCTCEHATANDGWCHECGVGYVAGIRVPFEHVFEALDAHGHRIPLESLNCVACREAFENDGFCNEHRRGWVGGDAWLSRLTYHLAKGERRSLDSIECSTCRAHAESFGWCDEHRVGMVGNVAIRRRADFEQAARAMRVLLDALTKAESCSTCAVAMVVDGRCGLCRISYRDGKPAEN